MTSTTRRCYSNYACMAYTSEELKWSIISTWKQCKDISATARQLKLSRKVVSRWVTRYTDTGGVTQASKSGRKPALSPAAAEQALELLLAKGSSGAQGVALQLHQQGLTPTKCHKTTIIRAAKKVAQKKGQSIQAFRGKPAKRLTHDTKSKRLIFCTFNKSRSWANVMFTDRKKFLFSYPGAKVQPVEWGYKGSSRQASMVNHPQVVNIYAGITKYGVTACHVVAGTSKHKSTYFNQQGKVSRNITSSEYKDVLLTTLLPEGRRLFSAAGIASWVLQQDNDPSHKVASTAIYEWNSKHASSIALLGKWPPNSPDLNPIENVWSYVQAKVNSQGCKTFEEFKAAVTQQFKCVPKAMLENLIESMGSRTALAIQAGGDKTPY